MTRILLVSNNEQAMEAFAKELRNYSQNRVEKVATGKEALAITKSGKIDVVAADVQLGDCSGLDLIKEIAAQSPLVNSSLVSSLPAEEFHEKTEGLGVFMQLPEYPGKEEAVKMMDLLESIYVLLAM